MLLKAAQVCCCWRPHGLRISRPTKHASGGQHRGKLLCASSLQQNGLGPNRGHARPLPQVRALRGTPICRNNCSGNQMFRYQSHWRSLRVTVRPSSLWTVVVTVRQRSRGPNLTPPGPTPTVTPGRSARRRRPEPFEGFPRLPKWSRQTTAQPWQQPLRPPRQVGSSSCRFLSWRETNDYKPAQTRKVPFDRDPLTVPRSRTAPSPQPKSDLSDFGRSIE